MKIIQHKHFEKSLKSRIVVGSSLYRQYKKRLVLFANNPNHPLLKDHALSGKMIAFRSFSVSGDVRVIYTWDGDILVLYDIGTHNQVYK